MLGTCLYVGETLEVCDGNSKEKATLIVQRGLQGWGGEQHL